MGSAPHTSTGSSLRLQDIAWEGKAAVCVRGSLNQEGPLGRDCQAGWGVASCPWLPLTGRNLNVGSPVRDGAHQSSHEPSICCCHGGCEHHAEKAGLVGHLRVACAVSRMHCHAYVITSDGAKENQGPDPSDGAKQGHNGSCLLTGQVLRLITGTAVSRYITSAAILPVRRGGPDAGAMLSGPSKLAHPVPGLLSYRQLCLMCKGMGCALLFNGLRAAAHPWSPWWTPPAPSAHRKAVVINADETEASTKHRQRTCAFAGVGGPLV
jgi:hypothetical protein